MLLKKVILISLEADVLHIMKIVITAEHSASSNASPVCYGDVCAGVMMT